MTREEAARLMHAYVDGELDPAKSLELEALMTEHSSLRTACERLRGMSEAIRDKADYHCAPADLAARLRDSLPALSAPRGEAGETPRPSFWRLLPGTGVALAAVAFLTWTIATGTLRPGEDERIAQDVLGSHVRATLGQRLYDIASTDQHTVKPWLSARLSYSPPVADYSAHGFELRGARLDYVGGQPVAVLVYARRQHSIDLYVWPARGPDTPRALTRDGFNLQEFAGGGMDFWLVSDLNKNELGDFARLLAQNSAAP